MTYTINGKQYTEFDIKKRCAELMGFDFRIYGDGTVHKGVFDLRADKYFDPCANPSDTWPIIENIWDVLMSDFPTTKWEQIIEKYGCTKLVAACICFIEVNS